MKIKFYNTLSRRKEVFKSFQPGKVGIYACGPTVYDFSHLGHFRAYIFVDTLRRALFYNNYQVKHVMNITDVGHLTDDADQGEDKVEKKASKEKRSVLEIARFYTDDFFKAMKLLNVQTPNIVCKATEHISEMINLISLIEKNSYTYQINDGIYFDTSKLADYGYLARLDIKNLKEGARVKKNLEKRQSTDFALWKFSPKNKKRQMEWDSPWGKGFPGWHIECTAMAVKYLGQNIDIHTGGIDHIPVHHTNEIAQAKGAFGKDIVRFWMHNAFLTIDSQKMSKSKGNFYTMHDILKRKFNPLAVRYFFLQAHYRKTVNFTWQSLSAAQSALENLHSYLPNKKLVSNKSLDLTENKYYLAFLNAINNDLNTAKALAVLWETVKDQSVTDQEKLNLVLNFDQVLGLGLGQKRSHYKKIIPNKIKKLAKKREQARADQNFQLADKLRQEIENKGFKLEDTDQGFKILKK